MVLTTKRNIPVERKYLDKITLLAERCIQKQPKLDSVVTIDGYEGYGKTTMSILTGYIASQLTNRPFSEKNLFFDVEKLTEFAKSNKEQIIIWDEAVLGGLSTEWFKETQINLTKLLMTCRKHRHFIIFNIPRFFRLTNTIATERNLALIHVYARNEVEVGRFVWIKRKHLFPLYDKIKSTKNLNWYKNYYTFRGTFPNILDKAKEYNILDIFDVDDYERRKDKAIMSIGKKSEKVNQYYKKLLELQYKIAKIPKSKVHRKDLAKWLNISDKTLWNWERIPTQSKVLSNA